MTYEKLVNPVEVFKAQEPGAFGLLPGGSDDLRPEIELMVARADSQGRPHYFSLEPEVCLVPEDICLAVFSSDHYEDDIQSELYSVYGNSYISEEATKVTA